MKITPTSLTIAQLLGSENEQYVIPAYQRRFSWRRHQVQDFWDDLQFLEDADTHLLGTIVCLPVITLRESTDLNWLMVNSG